MLLLFFGIVVGFFLSLIFEDEVSSSFLTFLLLSAYSIILQIYLRPSWFFIYLLPLIVLEAGYFLKNKQFFRNIGTICTYAVIGTVFNTVCIGTSVWILLYMQELVILSERRRKISDRSKSFAFPREKGRLSILLGYTVYGGNHEDMIAVAWT